MAFWNGKTKRMTIKEQLNLINKILDDAYNNLQKLPYNPDIELFIRTKLLDITTISEDLAEFVNLSKNKSTKNKLKNNDIQ